VFNKPKYRKHASGIALVAFGASLGFVYDFVDWYHIGKYMFKNTICD
jgi:hypothetical protein